MFLVWSISCIVKKCIIFVSILYLFFANFGQRFAFGTIDIADYLECMQVIAFLGELVVTPIDSSSSQSILKITYNTIVICIYLCVQTLIWIHKPSFYVDSDQSDEKRCSRLKSPIFKMAENTILQWLIDWNIILS